MRYSFERCSLAVTSIVARIGVELLRRKGPALCCAAAVMVEEQRRLQVRTSHAEASPYNPEQRHPCNVVNNNGAVRGVSTSCRYRGVWLFIVNGTSANLSRRVGRGTKKDTARSVHCALTNAVLLWKRRASLCAM